MPSKTARCHQCRYNLTGAPGPNCPECGTPIDPSRHAPSAIGMFFRRHARRTLFWFVSLAMIAVVGRTVYAYQHSLVVREVRYVDRRYGRFQYTWDLYVGDHFLRRFRGAVEQSYLTPYLKTRSNGPPQWTVDRWSLPVKGNALDTTSLPTPGTALAAPPFYTAALLRIEQRVPDLARKIREDLLRIDGSNLDWRLNDELLAMCRNPVAEIIDSGMRDWYRTPNGSCLCIPGPPATIPQTP